MLFHALQPIMVILVLCFGILISRPTIRFVSSEFFKPVLPTMHLCCTQMWTAHNRSSKISFGPDNHHWAPHWLHDDGVCLAPKMYHCFRTLRRGQSKNTPRVADTPKTQATEQSFCTVKLHCLVKRAGYRVTIVRLHICVVLCVVQSSYKMASLYMSCFPLSSCLICINLFSSSSPQFILLLIYLHTCT